MRIEEVVDTVIVNDPSGASESVQRMMRGEGLPPEVKRELLHRTPTGPVITSPEEILALKRARRAGHPEADAGGAEDHHPWHRDRLRIVRGHEAARRAFLRGVQLEVPARAPGRRRRRIACQSRHQRRNGRYAAATSTTGGRARSGREDRRRRSRPGRPAGRQVHRRWRGSSSPPAIIDIHVHGSAGHDTMDGTREAIEGMAALLRHPRRDLVLSDHHDRCRGGHPAVRPCGVRCMAAPGEGRVAPGRPPRRALHRRRKEGRPARPSTCAAPLAPRSTSSSSPCGNIRLISLAPEVEAESRADRLRPPPRRRPSPWATPPPPTSRCVEAVKLGLNQSTHTFNQMEGLHHRKPGTVGAALAAGRDLRPVHRRRRPPPPRHRRPGGAPEGPGEGRAGDRRHPWRGHAGRGVRTRRPARSWCRTARCDSPTAPSPGSCLTMDLGVRNIYEFTGAGLGEAIRMATLTPARAIGVAAPQGQPGAGQGRGHRAAHPGPGSGPHHRRGRDRCTIGIMGRGPPGGRASAVREQCSEHACAGTVVIGQSGGPTAVINSSLCGIIQEAMRRHEIEGIYGARHGVVGILNEDLADLRARRTRPRSTCCSSTPGAALGSCRHKLPHGGLAGGAAALPAHPRRARRA